MILSFRSVAPRIRSFTRCSMTSVSSKHKLEPSEPTAPEKCPKLDDPNPIPDASTVVSTESLPASSTDGDIPRVKLHRRKYALVFMYCGQGYFGLQYQPGLKTVEGDLITALRQAELITDDDIENTYKIKFQRASRTDKGVSALCQVVSLLLPTRVDDHVERINKYLPPHIKVLNVLRVTKGFDAKEKTSHRTYIYLLPTFAFTPIEMFVTDKFRVSSEVMCKVNKVLSQYKGTHNFHNFTSGKKPFEQSAYRYIMSCECETPFEVDGLEFALIRIKGQSFMIHQIRKMVGLLIAIVRGMGGDDLVEKAFQPDRIDIPKAPGLGLILETIHYDYYNDKFAKDGSHEPLVFDKFASDMAEFKSERIFKSIVQTEKADKSMMKWMTFLLNHHYDIISTNLRPRLAVGHGQAEELVNNVRDTIAEAKREAHEKTELDDGAAAAETDS